jgi:hypothetical protein
MIIMEHCMVLKRKTVSPATGAQSNKAKNKKNPSSAELKTFQADPANRS